MGIITESTNRKNRYVPYAPFDTTGLAAALSDEEAVGFAYLVADADSVTTVYVTMDDSYKFAVGDHLTAVDSDYAANDDLGAITAIDRTTYSHMAGVTFTNAITAIEASKGAAIAIQTKTASPYVQAKGILVGSVDTGTGENAKGAEGSIVLKNAMLYKDCLYCYNADSLTDLGGSEDGKYLII
jgi:hypothetical protein